VKILLVGDYPNDPRLGSPKVFYKLREEYFALGHTCDLILANQLSGVPANRHLRQVLAPFAASTAIDQYVSRHGPIDIVDIASGEGSIFGIKRLAGSGRRKIAFISRSNGLEHLNYRRMIDDHNAGLMYKPWTRRIWHPAVRLNQVASSARLADKLIVLNVNDFAFAAKRRWKNDADIHVVNHGVSDRFLREPLASQSRGAGLLFCGSWDEVKGITYLVRAYERVVAEGRKINLTILGGGLNEEIIRARFSPDAQKYLTIIPRVDEAGVIDQYRRHDALILPSTYEGFGMVIVEAMSQGLPVIATNVGCASALIKNIETGIVVRPRDSDEIAAAISFLLAHAKERERLAENARALVQRMTWRETALQTLDIYEQAMNRRVVRQ
jgi:glycosyltransferase involved in cell wall biosynthesis